MASAYEDLTAAISALGRSKRRALTASLAVRRDANVGHDPAMAEFYNSLAVVVAEVSDAEARVLRVMQSDLDTPPAA